VRRGASSRLVYPEAIAATVFHIAG